LLLEKEKMPRYKPCGGGVTAKVRGLLDFDFSATIEDTIRMVSVAYGADRVSVGYNDPIAWMVMRDKFDMLLAQRAANAGAQVRDRQPVTRIAFDDDGASVSTRGETLHAKLVVGADGANGIVRRAANFPPHQRMAVALEAEMEAPSASLEQYHKTLHVDFGAIRWGYAWIFPKAEHLSIGVGVLMRPNHPLDLRAELARYIKSEPTLRGATEMFARGHRIPLGGRFAKYHAPRAVLVGDAAGVVDPFSAEGIYYAIRSGMIAAEEITRAFERGGSSTELADLSSYTRRINAEISSDFRYAWWMAQVFYRVPHFGYRVFRRSKRTQIAAEEVLGGLVTYPQLLLGFAKGLVRSIF